MLGCVVFGALAIAAALRSVRSACRSLDSPPPGHADLAIEDAARTPSLFEEPTKFLSIVVPAYCEASRLPATLKETMRYLRRRRDRVGPHFTYEVLVVDDGSRDDTPGAARGAVKEHGADSVRLLRLPANCGKGAAVRAGMLRARGALCLMMDADGSTAVSDVEKLEAELKRVSRPPAGAPAKQAGGLGGKGLVLDAASWDCSLAVGGRVGSAFGSRAHLEQAATAKRSWYRNALMHSFHVLVWAAAGHEVRDTQCGFKLFTRRAAGLLFANQRLRRWCFDVELVRLARMLAVPVAEVQVKWAEVPGSKVKFWHVAHMAWELVLVKLGYTRLGGWKVTGEAELYKKAK